MGLDSLVGQFASIFRMVGGNRYDPDKSCQDLYHRHMSCVARVHRLDGS